MTFATRLKQLRLAAGLSRKELAASSGLSPAAIRDYEQGARKPSFENVVRIAAALGGDCRAFEACVAKPARASRKPPAKPGHKRTSEAGKRERLETRRGGVADTDE